VQEVGLEVSDVVVLIDREQGGREHLRRNSLTLHAAFTLSFIVDTLLSKGLLTAGVVDSVKRFIAENQTSAGAGVPCHPRACSASKLCDGTFQHIYNIFNTYTR
jgi:uridine monophosphate synthetase